MKEIFNDESGQSAIEYGLALLLLVILLWILWPHISPYFGGIFRSKTYP